MINKRTVKPGRWKAEEEFVRAVPWGDHRMMLVFRRHYGHKSFVRVRIWNRHTEHGFWYPDKSHKSALVVRLDDGHALADAIHAAVDGESQDQPDWLTQFEQRQRDRARKGEDD